MDSRRLLELASDVRVDSEPTLPESCINGKRRLHQERRANYQETIGSVMDLYRELGHPGTQEFIGSYFKHSSGRSPQHLAGVVSDLVQHCRKNGISGCSYDEDAVAYWFLYLVFVRTVTGGRAEKALFEKLGGNTTGWRYTTGIEDGEFKLDLVNKQMRHAVQVKPMSWTDSIPAWIRTAKRFTPTCKLWLVRYTGRIQFSFSYFAVNSRGVWEEIDETAALSSLASPAVDF